MRVALLFLLLFGNGILSAQTVTLNDILIRIPGQKTKVTGYKLVQQFDPAQMMVQGVYYKSHKKFTGTISDQTYGNIQAEIQNGKVVSFVQNKLSGERYSFHVVSSGTYSWFALDSAMGWPRNSTPLVTGEYFLDSAGIYRSKVTTLHPNGSRDVVRWQLSEMIHHKNRFVVAYREGWLEHHDRYTFLEYTEMHHDDRNGLKLCIDSTGKITERSFWSYDSAGFFGECFFIDANSGQTTTGHYKYDHRAGMWTTTSFACTTKNWYNAEFNSEDSSKSWYPSGALKEENYYYGFNSGGHPNHVQRTYFENGQLKFLSKPNPENDHDTTYAVYFSNGKPKSLIYQYHGHVATKTWEEDGSQLTLEAYAVSPWGRDSVYREWNSNGELIVESFYDHGLFLHSTIDTRPPVLNYRDLNWYKPAATAAIVLDAENNQRDWDTSLVVPENIIDSVAKAFSKTRELIGYGGPDIMAMTYWYYHGNNHMIYYNLIVADVDSCNYVDHKVVTSNIALNLFLDSIGFFFDGSPHFMDWGKHSTKSHPTRTFFTHPSFNDTMLNLSYLNRRLEQLQPGSYIEFHRTGEYEDAMESINLNKELVAVLTYPATILYYPQGTPTKTGLLPWTLVAFAPEASQSAEWKEHDPRTYSACIIYGNGDVEYLTEGSIMLITGMLGLPLPVKTDRTIND